jgi:hypothetical protein
MQPDRCILLFVSKKMLHIWCLSVCHFVTIIKMIWYNNGFVIIQLLLGNPCLRGHAVKALIWFNLELLQFRSYVIYNLFICFAPGLRGNRHCLPDVVCRRNCTQHYHYQIQRERRQIFLWFFYHASKICRCRLKPHFRSFRTTFNRSLAYILVYLCPTIVCLDHFHLI